MMHLPTKFEDYLDPLRKLKGKLWKIGCFEVVRVTASISYASHL